MLFEEFLSFTNCDLGFVIPSSNSTAGLMPMKLDLNLKL